MLKYKRMIKLLGLLVFVLMTLGINGCAYLQRLPLVSVKETEIDKKIETIEQVSVISQTATLPTSIEQLTDIYGDNKVDLLKQLQQRDAKIDSLYTFIDYLFFKADSLTQELEYYNGRVTVNQDFEVPRKFTFAGRVFDLSNDRMYHKFTEIFENELKAAHRFIPRSGNYFALFDSVFAHYEVPADMRYLAIAESGLTAMATSQVGAGGIWQFMPATARQYGLTISSFIDERRDVFKATDAAARYLTNSYRYFQNRGAEDWLLAMCAYNAGDGSVARVMREQQANDFFDLIMRVDETNRYVWRSAAIKLIFDNEEILFGEKFEREAPLTEVTRRETLKLNGHHRIDEWAVAQGTVLRRVWELNPWINLYQRQRQRYSAINDMVLPPGEYQILLPIESRKDEAALVAIERKLLDQNSGHFTHHTVQRGETLYGIARRYKTSVTNIMSMNNLRSSTIHPGQRLQLMGSTGSGATGNSVYVVQRGDSLDGIAKKLNVSLNHLLSRNNLSVQNQGGRRIVIIHPGQRLYY